MKRRSDPVSTAFAPTASMAMLAGMLLAAWLAPESRWLAAARGESTIHDELIHAHGAGYYEALLDAAPNSTGEPQHGAPAQRPAPPGIVPFEDSGAVLADPGYARSLMRPNLNLRWNGTTIRTNSRGYRGPEIITPKPPGTYRVVVLGSSNTMGHGIDDEEGYIRRLESWLRKRHGGPGRTIEVVNLAVPGQTASQRLYRLKTGEVERLEPDWIISDATAIDIWFEQEHLYSMLSRGVPIPPELPYVRAIIEKSGLKPGDDSETFHKKLMAFHEELTQETFDGWADEAQRIGVPMSVVLLPRVDSDAPSRHIFGLLRGCAQSAGLDLIDLSHAFDGRDRATLKVGYWDQHPNAQGHRLIFEAIEDELKRRGIPPIRDDDSF